MTPLLEVEGLRTVFETPRGAVRAVNDASFTVDDEIVGIVGESGSGKSTAVRSVIRLVRPPGRVTAGRALLGGRDLLQMSGRELRAVYGQQIGFVAQNPFGALNPVLRIEQQFANIVRAHRKASAAEIRELAWGLLRSAGIPDPERVLGGYAHELSGGMAQRVVIAMAISLEPRLLIADEPTTALDLTVQRQLLDTLHTLVRGAGRSMILVTHDLGVVGTYCDRVIVMYAGRVVEQGPVRAVFGAPQHPYTAALLAAATGATAAAPPVRGTALDLIDYPRGCPYHARCPRALDHCRTEVPVLAAAAGATAVSCHSPLVPEADDVVAAR